jgi:hypothetical protein
VLIVVLAVLASPCVSLPCLSTCLSSLCLSSPRQSSPSSPPHPAPSTWSQSSRGSCRGSCCRHVHCRQGRAAHSSRSRPSRGCCRRVVITATGGGDVVGVVAVGHWLQGQHGVDVVMWRLASRCGLCVCEGRGRRRWLGLLLSCPGL